MTCESRACRRDGEGPPGYSPGVGKFDSDIFRGLDNLYPGKAALHTTVSCRSDSLSKRQLFLHPVTAALRSPNQICISRCS